MARIRGISSMATRHLLAELAEAYAHQCHDEVSIESVGGVDAARRVQAGEPFDLVVLASGAIDSLLASGHLVAGSRTDLVRSGVSIAVRRGAPRPAIDSEAAVRQAVQSARSIGYSTGPSGAHLVRLFERWGIADEVAARTVQAPPGVPVGTLVARGEVELGFQQTSELRSIEGIDVLGELPPAIQVHTVFSGGIGAAALQPEAARRLLAFMASPLADDVKRRHAMEPA